MCVNLEQTDKVSVVIASYNSSAYITRAIHSVLSQNYADIEIIIADDASTDNTCALVSQLDDPRIKLICLPAHRGQATARNTAIRAATGRYIAFLDSDDYWLSDKLTVQIGKMKARRAVFSHTNYWIKWEDEEAETLFEVPEKINSDYLLTHGNIIHTSSAIYDAGVLGKIYMPSFPLAEDYATWLTLLSQFSCGSALGVRQNLAYRIRRPDSLSSRYAVMRWFHLKVYLDIQELSLVRSLYYLFIVQLRSVYKRVEKIISLSRRAG